jgi:hypothetical protein
MSRIKVVLEGGEKDGLELELSHSDVPQIYYAVPNLDDDKIKNTKGNDTKRELRDKLAVLAYKYDPLSSGPGIYRMIRAPHLDKVTQI